MPKTTSLRAGLDISVPLIFTRPAAAGGSGLYLRNSVSLSVSLSVCLTRFLHDREAE
jgi:hypothetical protein